MAMASHSYDSDDSRAQDCGRGNSCDAASGISDLSGTSPRSDNRQRSRQAIIREYVPPRPPRAKAPTVELSPHAGERGVRFSDRRSRVWWGRAFGCACVGLCRCFLDD